MARFPQTYCSQCGGEFGPGDHGFSHCYSHQARNADPVKLLHALINCFDALDQSEAYFDNRADADCDQDGFIPNEEMKLLSAVTEALNTLQPILREHGVIQ